MILTPRMIDRMRLYSSIDEHLEKLLLRQLGTEPYPHVYTEQDLHEQSRKIIEQYNENLATTSKRRIEPGVAPNAKSIKKTGGKGRKIHKRLKMAKR